MSVRAAMTMLAAALLASGDAHAARTEAPGFAVVATTPARPLLIESVARAADGGLLASSVHTARIYRLAADGSLSVFGPEAEQAVFGMVADPSRNALWTAVSPAPQDTVEDQPAALVRRDLATGEIVARYPAPAPAHPSMSPGEAHVFGDVALGPDGAVYVADSVSGQVLVLRPGAEALTVLAALGERASPQGMAISPDGLVLLVASWSAGLYRIPLYGGDPVLMEPPLETELRGIDGLVRHGADLVAIQNGTRTHRILRLTLDPFWLGVTERRVLAETPSLVEPTTGFIEDDHLVFVARSQWPDFERDGAPKSATPQGAVIGRLRLAAPPRYLCLPAGNFRLAEDEELAAGTGSTIRITSPRGDLDLQPNTFDGAAPEVEEEVAASGVGGVYRISRPVPGYAFSIINPVEEGEVVIAWISGSALTGEAGDAAIYERFQIMSPPLPCHRTWDDGNRSP